MLLSDIIKTIEEEIEDLKRNYADGFISSREYTHNLHKLEAELEDVKENGELLCF